jgi:hypothetical protein
MDGKESLPPTSYRACIEQATRAETDAHIDGNPCTRRWQAGRVAQIPGGIRRLENIGASENNSASSLTTAADTPRQVRSKAPENGSRFHQQIYFQSRNRSNPTVTCSRRNTKLITSEAYTRRRVTQGCTRPSQGRSCTAKTRNSIQYQYH